VRQGLGYNHKDMGQLLCYNRKGKARVPTSLQIQRLVNGTGRDKFLFSRGDRLGKVRRHVFKHNCLVREKEVQPKEERTRQVSFDTNPRVIWEVTTGWDGSLIRNDMKLRVHAECSTATYSKNKLVYEKHGLSPLQGVRYRVESPEGASLFTPVVKPGPFPPDCLPNLNLEASQGPYRGRHASHPPQYLHEAISVANAVGRIWTYHKAKSLNACISRDVRSHSLFYDLPENVVQILFVLQSGKVLLQKL